MIIRESDIRRIVRRSLSDSLEEGKKSKGKSSNKAKPAEKKTNPAPERPKKDKSFVSVEEDWPCWTRKEKDSRGEAGTLAWDEEVMKNVWRENGLSETSEQAESVRDAAEKYLANSRYDTLFNSESDDVLGEKMSRILKAIAVVESRMNTRVNRGFGRGLMQLTQDAIDQIKINRDKATNRNNPAINPFDPGQAIKGAAEYVRWLIQRPSVTNLASLLTAYNSGPYAKQKVDPFYSNKVIAMMDLLEVFESQTNYDDGQFEGLRTDLFRA